MVFDVKFFPVWIFMFISLFFKNRKIDLYIMLFTTIIFNITYNVWPDLFDWKKVIFGLGGGLIIGYIFFWFSTIFLTHFTDFKSGLISLGEYKVYFKKASWKYIFGMILSRAFLEEWIWRGTYQTILGTLMGAVAVSVFFTVAHRAVVRNNDIFKWIELCLFSIFLAGIYMLTKNLYLTFAIHFVRNLNIRVITFCHKHQLRT